MPASSFLIYFKGNIFCFYNRYQDTNLLIVEQLKFSINLNNTCCVKVLFNELIDLPFIQLIIHWINF